MNDETQDQPLDIPDLPPVVVSGRALRSLSQYLRHWTGWRDARLIPTAPPAGAPGRDVAMTDTGKHTINLNVDALTRNPNRVLDLITPFRLKQEAVMTGVLLHEAGHARHSRWLEDKTMLHDDGTEITKAEVALARLMEEARVEGFMARNVSRIGANGLAWTMRAANAAIVPPTNVSADPNQQILDIIESWALRSAKAAAVQHHAGTTFGGWVKDFTDFVKGRIERHLEVADPDGATYANAGMILRILLEMAAGSAFPSGTTDDGAFKDETFEVPAYNHADTGSWMVDKARDALTLLFPETPPDEMPQACGGCGSTAPQGADGDAKGDEQGEGGEGNTEPEDEGSGDEPGAGDSGQGEEQEGDGLDEAAAQFLANQLAKREDAAQKGEQQMASEQQAKAEAEGEVPQTPGKKSGGREGGQGGNYSDRGYRQPSASERAIKKGAEQFLRGLIDPAESSKVMLTDQPSAQIDGAALAAWKAGGQSRDPQFFRRAQRTITPSPPVKIAVLVDVSSSMGVLQKPSAVLSWACAAAALDLRNFAGRGAQIETCLIHWGSTVHTILEPGQMLPGIKEYACTQGTSAMDGACMTVESLMPGFFDGTGMASNRLLVQFTDWELFGTTDVQPWMNRAMASGVNMLSVVPRGYSGQRGSLGPIMDRVPLMRGKSEILRYDKANPGEVWNAAAEMLR